jgi:hypothetical protein
LHLLPCPPADVGHRPRRVGGLGQPMGECQLSCTEPRDSRTCAQLQGMRCMEGGRDHGNCVIPWHWRRPQILITRPRAAPFPWPHQRPADSLRGLPNGGGVLVGVLVLRVPGENIHRYDVRGPSGAEPEQRSTPAVTSNCYKATGRASSMAEVGRRVRCMPAIPRAGSSLTAVQGGRSIASRITPKSAAGFSPWAAFCDPLCGAGVQSGTLVPLDPWTPRHRNRFRSILRTAPPRPTPSLPAQSRPIPPRPTVPFHRDADRVAVGQ